MKPATEQFASAEAFIIADVGSTTTKATLFERAAGGWRYRRSEAPTTVEKPHEDVTIGLTNALTTLQSETGRQLLADRRPALPFLATSSAGGGLAMVVTGLVADITAESADRAALGAGAIVLDTIAMNDGRTPYRKINDLKHLRPDMVLLAGGFDGDAITGPVYLAELLVEAGLRPKLSPNVRLAVVYAGNSNAREQVAEVLKDGYRFVPVENIRPDDSTENFLPTRRAIHELFMNHVMSQAPGYDRLQSWAAAPLMPTPAAFGSLLARAAKQLNRRILAVDIGGATTDVFSALEGEVFRTVSANLGLSYSIRNVAELGGVSALDRFYRPGADSRETWNIIGNKTLDPTRPAADHDAMRVEWGAAAVAVRTAVEQHLQVMQAESEPTEPESRDIVALLRLPLRRRDKPERLTVENLSSYDLFIGSGGIMSHSPRPAAAMMLIDALQPTGGAELAVDRAFLFPHLGVLASVNPDLALELFEQLALVRLGRLSAAGGGKTVSLQGHSVRDGEVVRIADKQTEVGLIIDNRARPVTAGADSLIAGERYVPPEPVRTEEEPVIRTGRLRLRRELAIPGEVLVKVGQQTRPDTVVARSSRQFLRPFFLDPKPALGRAEETDTGTDDIEISVRVGEELSLGQVYARRRRRFIGDKIVRSNVEGRVERILPGKVVVVRERPEAAREYTTVPAAKELGVEPAKLDRFLRVAPGQEVERGQWLAATGDPGRMTVSRSPVRGRVNRVDRNFGMVIIEPLLEEVEVRAWLPGTVAEVTELGAVVEASGTTIRGTWGLGGEGWGKLSRGEPGAGLVIVRDRADRRLLDECGEAGCAGLVCGGLNLEDALGLKPGFSLVMLGRYGDDRITAEPRELFERAEGRLTLVDGTTQLRVGVVRPRVILPD